MVSCFKNLLLVSLLALAVSCGQDGVAPGFEGLSSEPYRGLTCDHTFSTNTTAATFASAIQPGTASKNFVACVALGVEIGDTSDSTDMNKSYVTIVAESQGAGAINNLSIQNAKGINVYDVHLIGTSHFMGDSECITFWHADGGANEFNVDGVTCMGEVSGIYVVSRAANPTTINITNSLLVVGNHGIHTSSDSASNTVVNVGGNTIVSYRASGNYSPYGFYTGKSADSTATFNDISKSNKNFVCNYSTSTSTFSKVWENSGLTGNFTVAGTRNGSQTVGTCPASIEMPQ